MKNFINKSDIEYIDKLMSAVEDVMKEQTGSECRKNVWETVSILKKEYPDCSDYVENKLKELAQRYDTDFFEEIR
jgi:hypothetical protein